MRIIRLWYYLCGRAIQSGNLRASEANEYSAACGFTMVLWFILMDFLSIFKLYDFPKNIHESSSISFILDVASFLLIYIIVFIYFRSKNRGNRIIQEFSHLKNATVVSLFFVYIFGFILLFVIYDKILMSISSLV